MLRLARVMAVASAGAGANRCASGDRHLIQDRAGGARGDVHGQRDGRVTEAGFTASASVRVQVSVPRVQLQPKPPIAVAESPAGSVVPLTVTVPVVAAWPVIRDIDGIQRAGLSETEPFAVRTGNRKDRSQDSEQHRNIVGCQIGDGDIEVAPVAVEIPGDDRDWGTSVPAA